MIATSTKIRKTEWASLTLAQTKALLHRMGVEGWDIAQTIRLSTPSMSTLVQYPEDGSRSFSLRVISQGCEEYDVTLVWDDDDAELAAAIERDLAAGRVIDSTEWIAREQAKDAAEAEQLVGRVAFIRAHGNMGDPIVALKVLDLEPGNDILLSIDFDFAQGQIADAENELAARASYAEWMQDEAADCPHRKGAIDLNTGAWHCYGCGADVFDDDQADADTDPVHAALKRELRCAVIGQVVDGRYKVTSAITSAAGEVYVAASDPELGRSASYCAHWDDNGGIAFVAPRYFYASQSALTNACAAQLDTNTRAGI